MSFWTPDNIKSIVGGTWLARGASVDLGGAAIDSRAVRPGAVFFALRGEKTDGHRFLAAAAQQRAGLAVVDDPAACGTLPAGLSVLRVGNVGQAMLRLAGEYRQTLEGTRVISVSGSNGKTTTTRLLEGVLSAHRRGTASPKSFNNSIGVPLTILNARRGDAFLICEVGTNAPGEIAALARVVRPDIAVITSIGREHLEGLGSIGGVIDEESSIVSELQPGGLVILPDVPSELTVRVRARLASVLRAEPNIVRVGRGSEADLRIGKVSTDGAGTTFWLNDRVRLRVPLVGTHNALNAANVVAVARRMGLDDAAIASTLETCVGAEMRLRLERAGGVDVLNDAYNANPESMLAALETFAALGRTLGGSGGQRVAIVADMLELGDAGPEAHREIGEAIARDATIDRVVLVGPLMLFAADRLRRSWGGERVMIVPEASDEACREIASTLRPGDFVLLKGSRRMGLERVARALGGGGAEGAGAARAVAADRVG